MADRVKTGADARIGGYVREMAWLAGGLALSCQGLPMFVVQVVLVCEYLLT